MNAFWNVGALDRVILLFPVAVFAVILAGVLYRLGRKRRVRTTEFWEPIVACLTVVLVFVGIYAGYASFRNQTRLAAETALNDGADNLFAIEMDHPEIRCLYSNFGHDDPQACVARLAADRDRWSLAIFYVEESWFTLEKASEDRANWGSQYAGDIAYWADDVSDDPSGLFAFYLLNQHSVAQAKARMTRAGVCIPDLCGGYSKVRGALLAAKAASGPDLCASPAVRAQSRSVCPD